jgi:LmbE family N-acetylglucosaminyl deacetylase
MDESNTVLVVTPHPDDAESGAGGTIAKWSAQGRKIILVVCTNGDKGTSDRSIVPADLAKTREKEQLEAAKELGVSEVVFLRFPDYAGRVTLDAVFPYARDHLAYPEHLGEGLEPHKVEEVYLWGSETPDTFLEITDTFKIKMDALYRHVSQMGLPREEREERSRARYAEVGKKIGVPLAEQFKHIELWR